MKVWFNGFQDHHSIHLSFSDYLLYSFAAVLLVGVIVLMPLALVCKIWWGNWRQKECQSASLLLDGHGHAFLLAGWWKEEMKKGFIHWRKTTALLFSDDPWWNVCKLCSHGEIYHGACCIWRWNMLEPRVCSLIWIPGKTKMSLMLCLVSLPQGLVCVSPLFLLWMFRTLEQIVLYLISSDFSCTIFHY